MSGLELLFIGQRDAARKLFNQTLAARTRLGVLPEHVDLANSKLWDNFSRTNNVIAIIQPVPRLSAVRGEAF